MPLHQADLSSPRDTLLGFLEKMTILAGRLDQVPPSGKYGRIWREAIKSLDFSAFSDGTTARNATARLVLLKEILDRVPLPPAASIPGDAAVRKQGLVEWTIPGTPLRIVRLEHGSRRGDFVFSADSVLRLGRYYRQASHLQYKKGATPGLYAAFVAGISLSGHQKLTRIALKTIDTSSPFSTLSEFLFCMNQAYELIMGVERNIVEGSGEYSREALQEIETNAEMYIHRAQAALDLSAVPLEHRRDVGLETALLLKEVIDRLALPPSPFVPDTFDVAEERALSHAKPLRWQYPDSGIEIAEVLQGEQQGRFLFSPETVRRALEYYEKVMDLPYRPQALTDESRADYISPDVSEGFYRYYTLTPGDLIPHTNMLASIINGLPAWMHTVYGGQTCWQWLALLACTGGAVAIAVVLIRASARFGRRMERPCRYWLWVLVLSFLALLFSWTLRFLNTDINLTGSILVVSLTAGKVLVIAFWIWAAVMLCKAVVETVISAPSFPRESINASLLRIVSLIASILAGCAIAIAGARQLGLDMIPLLAGLGVGGLAVALATQRTFANFIGSLILYANKPVRVGDFCRYGDQIGTVEHIGLLSTRIRSLERTVVTVPNADFSEMQLDNFQMRDQRLLRTTLQLRYETSPEQMRWVLAKLRELLLGHPRVSPDPARVRFVGFGSYSKDIEVFAYLKCQDQSTFLSIQEDILLRIEDIVMESGSGFAFPSQTSYLCRDSGLESENAKKVEAEVGRWREENELPFPEFSEKQRRQMENTLSFPPKGSPGKK